MPDTMVRAILHTTDQIVENFVQNQFCIQTTATDIDVDAVTTAVQNFYRSFNGFYPVTIAGTGHELKFYDLPGTQPNYPFAETAWSFTTPPSGASGPSEMAVCLSFQATREPGFPQARKRGRIFIGPLDGSLTQEARPSVTIRNGLTASALVFAQDIIDIPGHRWAVWSSVDQSSSIISGGYVDDAWDVQRRRGLDPSTRTTFVVPF